ncbi:MAG: hypothetical protein PUC68_08095 [Firmicutes bacterium]|nr:hypothetical protein [Bacillota bacterium]
MAKNYLTEREGQIAFFNNFRIDYENNPVLIDNTDGVWKGNILEFKLNITNLNKVVFQTIKYLSKMRIKGEAVPANILIVDLNQEICYVYHSQDYFEDIHKVYIGGASTNNENFTAGNYREKIDYSTQEGSLRVLQLLQENNYMKIKIDENCIVGWAERYYKEHPHANKGDFLGDETGKIKVKGEIREPKYFKEYILPFEDTTNERFKYLMGVLNDRLNKKELGAFYTPMLYAEKACELVKMAIDRVPEGNDYIILDRCSGTGNLEQAIINKLGDDVASHIICSTFEYYEYKVLLERIGDKVKAIIPPTEENVIYSNGCVLNADALSKDYINNPIIKSYVDNPECSIILFENPPYHDESSNSQGNQARTRNISYVKEEMKKEIKGNASNDLANRFIWSAFKYYLRQDTDSYILFSPLKYWKSQSLVNKKFVKGYLFNRKHFNATESGVGCVFWKNEEDKTNEISLEAFNICDDELKLDKNITVKKVFNTPAKLFDKRKEDNYIAYMNCSGFNLSNDSRSLYRTNTVKGHGSCFYVYPDVYLEKLPLFVAKLYPQDNWFEKDVIYTTTDKGDAYKEDEDFLMKCLIYACLTNQNKCLSFTDNNGKYYNNELCFDKDTLASKELEKYELNDDENEVINLWNSILTEIKTHPEYNANLRYGTYQINEEINIYTEINDGRRKERRYKYPDLNGNLDSLGTKLKDYYKKYIAPKMFEYELLK